MGSPLRDTMKCYIVSMVWWAGIEQLVMCTSDDQGNESVTQTSVISNYSVETTPSVQGPPGFTWPWLLAPLACAFVILVCLEAYMIGNPCKRKYKSTRPLVSRSGGRATYASYGSSMDDVTLGGSSGLPSTTSLIPSSEDRHPIRVPCRVCGNTSTGQDVRMGVSLFQGNRYNRARNPRLGGEVKNPLYWYRVPIKENRGSTGTLDTISSGGSSEITNATGGQTLSTDLGVGASLRSTPTISLSVSTNTEFRGNDFFVPINAGRQREMVTPRVPSRNLPSYQSHLRRKRRRLSLEITKTLGIATDISREEPKLATEIEQNDSGNHRKHDKPPPPYRPRASTHSNVKSALDNMSITSLGWV